MARIQIKDLPRDSRISKEEMKKVLGGILVNSTITLFSPGDTILNKIQEKMGVEPSPF